MRSEQLYAIAEMNARRKKYKRKETQTSDGNKKLLLKQLKLLLYGAIQCSQQHTHKTWSGLLVSQLSHIIDRYYVLVGINL